MSHTPTLLRWLPADSRPGVRRRLLLVLSVTLVVALALWLNRSSGGGLEIQLVYSFAISLGIWFCSDPMRIALRHWYGAFEGPHYWRNGPLTWLHMVLSFLVGYVVGTLIGDAYAGQSTWELLFISPQRFWGYGVSTLLLTLGFNLYFQQRGKAEALEKQATEAQLQLLRAQLDPHMLFNTLANLRALIEQRPDQATEMLDRLVAYLRATLGASRADGQGHTHTLGDEVDRLQDYLALMAVRMGPRLWVQFNVPDELKSQPVLPLLLQPLVENAIRHGLEPQIDGGTIALQAQRQGDQLLLTLSDTGEGGAAIREASPDTHHLGGPHTGGLGLAHVRERLRTRYGAAAQMALHSPPGEGTRITLQWPLQT